VPRLDTRLASQRFLKIFILRGLNADVEDPVGGSPAAGSFSTLAING